MTKILAYHSIGESVAEVGANLYCVPVAEFRKQMEYVARVTKRQRYKETKIQETSHKSTRAQDTGIEVTFDDGDITNYTKAYPILKEFGMKASFFIIVEWVGAKGYMNWDQIKELEQAGMTIGSHGMTHRILLELKDDEIEHELKASKKLLEDNLGCYIDCLSVPRGFHSAKILNKARELGYKTIFTSDNRVVVRSDWNMDRFVRAMNSDGTLTDKARKLVLGSMKKLMGVKNYDKIRRLILR